MRFSPHGCLAVLALVACSGPDLDSVPEPPQVDDTATADTGSTEPTLAAPMIRTSEVVPSVFEVHFTSARPGASWVEVTDTVGVWSTPRLDDLDDHRHRLVGLKAGHEVTVQAVFEDDAGTQTRSEPHGITVPAAPAALPDFQLVEHDAAKLGAERFFVLTYTVGGAIDTRAVLLDQDGDPVWWLSLVDDGAVGMVKPARDGAAVQLAHFRSDTEDKRGIYRVPLDAMSLDEVTMAPAVDGHHDFAELPDGTIAHIADRGEVMDWDDHDDVSVRIDQIVEVSPAGDRQVVFDALDHAPELVRPYCYHTDVKEQGAMLGAGWGHANSLTYDEAADTYLLNLRNVDMILEVTRTGEVVSVIGSPASDYTFATPADAWDHGHFSDWRGDALGMFSNGLHDGIARLLWYRVDPVTRVLTTEWAYDHPEGESINSLGDLDLLPDGNRLAAWGPGSAIEVLTPAGERAWRVEAVPDTNLARASWWPSLYEPAP